ncbi:hypothetical protein [Niallia sp.]|nr:hypothetical protein [Niallia sp.]
MKKEGLKVTEKGSLSPNGKGGERKGNRERFSVPEWKRWREKR